jgi:hypothetical protein
VVQRYVERYHVVERREGQSFVGDLSVHEYLKKDPEDSDEEVDEEKVAESTES